MHFKIKNGPRVMQFLGYDKTPLFQNHGIAKCGLGGGGGGVHQRGRGIYVVQYSIKQDALRESKTLDSM